MKTSTIILILALVISFFGLGAIVGSRCSTATVVDGGQAIKEELMLMTVEFVFNHGLQDEYYVSLKAFADAHGLPPPPPPTNWFSEFTTSVNSK